MSDKGGEHNSYRAARRKERVSLSDGLWASELGVRRVSDGMEERSLISVGRPCSR